MFAVILGIGNSLIAQDEVPYSRGSGFVFRPEVYGGLFLNAGYQFNPYFQISLGLGPGLLLMQKQTYNSTSLSYDIDATMFYQAGVRVYPRKGTWSSMFDYHARYAKYKENNIYSHTIVGGASYKNLDFGGGLNISSFAGQIGFGFVVTVGWNFRL